MTEKQYPLFVYGTLRPEANNGWVMEYATRTERAYLDNFTLYDCGIPFIGVGYRSVVVGDLLYLDRSLYDIALGEFDEIEGYNPPFTIGYIRALLGVRNEDYRPIPAWVYLGGPSKPFGSARVISSGDYLKEY